MIRRRIGMAGALALAALTAIPCRAQVDPSGPWRTLHTAHFRIHFRPHYRSVAVVAANEAERAWGLLATELKAPRGTIDLTLSDDADIANGFATPVPSNRMTVLLTPPADEPSLQHYDSWLRIVIVHELAHLFHLDRTRGLWRLLQRAFGRAPGLFPNSYQPSWVVEGVATYYESRLTNGGRVSGELHTEILAAQAADDRTRSPWDAVYYTRWPGPVSPYAYGSTFLGWASSAHGDTLVPRLTESTAKQLIPFRVGRPYKRITGKPIAEDWETATQPAAAPGEPDTALVGALRQAPGPRVSPDGKQVAYLHDDGRAAPELRVLTRDDWRLERSHTVTANASYDWLGDTLVIAQLDFATRRQIRSDLYRWLPDGVWRRETHGRRLVAPRAGGGILTTIELIPAGHQPYIGGVAMPAIDTAGTTWGALVPSPDGRLIAATRHCDGHWQLVRWPRGRPDSVAVLVTSQDVITDPVWSMDGSLYFVMPRAGFSQVHRWTVDGPAVVTAAPRGARGPAPEPGGTFLYSTLEGEGWSLRRGRAIDPEPVDADPPRPFVAAPSVPTSETGYNSWRTARPHHWLPRYFDAGRAGRFVGVGTSGIDALGRIAFGASLLASPDPAPGRVLGGVFLAHDALGNPSFDASASSDWDLVGTTVSGITVSERGYDAALGATWAKRWWRSAVSVRLALEAEGSRFRTTPDVPIGSACNGCIARDFVGPSLSLRVARFVTAPLSVSAEDGFVWSALYRRREEQGNARWSGELQTRLSTYLRLPRVGFAHPVLALRLAAGATHGPSPLFFSVGGLSSARTDLGFGIRVGTIRSFPVRGYDASDMRGRRAATATAELRLPLALVSRSLGHLPVGLDRLWVSAFVDAGDAWTAGWTPHLTHLLSAGGELVADLRASYDWPLRARVGYAHPNGTQPIATTPRWYAALGADF
jgi:hypothetical protein